MHIQKQTRTETYTHTQPHKHTQPHTHTHTHTHIHANTRVYNHTRAQTLTQADEKRDIGIEVIFFSGEGGGNLLGAFIVLGEGVYFS